MSSSGDLIVGGGRHVEKFLDGELGVKFLKEEVDQFAR